MGKRVGFLKLVPQGSISPATGAGNEDADFLQNVLGLKKSDGMQASLDLIFSELEKSLAAGDKGLETRLKDSLSVVSSGKDVVIVEGLSGECKTSADLARLLGAKSLLVARYRKGLAGELASAARSFDPDLLGVVINAVPANRMEATPTMGGRDVKILGVIPQDRRLLAMTVGELAQKLQGEILDGSGGLDELVENVMVGAMALDPGPLYFNRKSGKAVITRSERSDIQLAALETPTRCLVLTGGTGGLVHQVVAQADAKGVPLIQVEMDTLAAVASLEDALGQVRFRQVKKMASLIETMGERFDFEALFRGLGLAS
jgi:BioD-like phosphotransacetylase family protein